MSTTTTPVTKPAEGYRLPTNVKPTHYYLIVKTDLEKQEFDGYVKISLDIHQETSSLCLNSFNLQLRKASVYSNTLELEQACSESFDDTLERVTFSFPTALPTGSKAELKIGFAGELAGNVTGYYKSTYEVKGEKRIYSSTQFQPVLARRAFPCWDEPLLKATFEISLVSRADTVNLSNMPLISEEAYSDTDLDNILLPLNTNDKWKITRFQTTPLMSSYIVAYANGHLEYLEKSIVMPLSGKTIPLRIYATSDNIHQAQFTLDLQAKVLPLYEKTFDIEYPLPKLDTLVANDFLGAMENWGLIIGGPRACLLDPKRADVQAKKTVASVQSHEVAHMWFGNITTMEWWNYLYLNEGFATLIGDMTIDKIFPEWRLGSEFISRHLNGALNLDAKLSSHPIEVECLDANRINQIFDSLSYSKAASVLRMLSHYVGEDLFLKGVSLYLKKNLYANSVTRDLWEGIRSATGIDITQIMDNWVSKTGFPVITVKETPTEIHVRQDRFLESGQAEFEDNEIIWNIPLTILSIDKNGKPIRDTVLLSKREGTIELDTSKPFKLNGGTVGVYRVLYTPERLAKIAAEAAKDNSIFSLDDRIGLVHDAMALSRAGLANLSSALTLLDEFKGEKKYLVWSGISASINDLISIWWEHPELLDQLNAFRRALFVPLVDKLGYQYSKAEDTDASLLRTCAITQAASAGDERVVEQLRNHFAYFMKTGDDSNIPADLQQAVFSTAVKYGGREEYNVVMGVYNKPRTPTSEISAMRAMGATEDSQLAKEIFDVIIPQARDKDVIHFFLGLSQNSKMRRLLAQFFKDKYDVLYKRFEGTFILPLLVETSMGNFCTEKDYAEVTDFFEDKDTSKYSLALGQTLDGIRARAAYIKRSSGDLGAWFEARSK